MKLPSLIRQIGKRIVKATPMLRRRFMYSSDYRLLGGPDEARTVAASSGGWFAGRTVERQERAYQGLIEAMKRGEPRIDFTVAAEAVEATGIANPSLLEVGCGSGYYSQVFATLLPGRVRYAGVDYSQAMISRARANYPAATFDVDDATRLSHADGAFDIVFNGVSLLHIVDYPAAIREAARVAARHCIFHTVPVFSGHRTTFLQKYAYGAPVIEIIFEKQELMAICRDAGLLLEREWPGVPYDVHEVTGHHSLTETYLFSKSVA
jgi:SAM-dependent methyltransferase